MKCPSCNGRGVVNFRNIHALCGKCQGIGFIDEPQKTVQSNEEWFDTLTTKGKAEIIAQLSSYGGNVNAILGWLREKHSG